MRRILRLLVGGYAAISVSGHAAVAAVYDTIDDSATGVRIAIPVDIVGQQPAPTKWGHNWGARKSRLSIDTLNFGNTRSLDELYNIFKRKKGLAVTRDDYRPGVSFVLEGLEDNNETIIHIEAHVARGEVRGLSMAYDTVARRTLDPVVANVIRSFQPFPVVKLEQPSPPKAVVTMPAPVPVAKPNPPPSVPPVAAPVKPPAAVPAPPKIDNLPPVAPSVEARLRKCPTIEGAKTRVALVIGNSKYVVGGDLRNPTKDALDISNALRSLGFEVVYGTDLDKRAMEIKLRQFNRKLAEAQEQPLALFFYAGHGMQVDGRNYLVPTDARLEKASDLDLDVIDVELVLRQMVAQTSCANLVFLDACRNNPLLERYFRSLGVARAAERRGGLAQMPGKIRETLIEFSAEANALADDGPGDNSPFAEALLQHIHSPGLDFQLMMRSVRIAVTEATKGRQRPTEYGDITKSIVLLPKPLPGMPSVGGGDPPTVR